MLTPPAANGPTSTDAVTYLALRGPVPLARSRCSARVGGDDAGAVLRPGVRLHVHAAHGIARGRPLGRGRRPRAAGLRRAVVDVRRLRLDDEQRSAAPSVAAAPAPGRHGGGSWRGRGGGAPRSGERG